MLKTDIGYWNNSKDRENNLVPSLDTGLLAMNYYDMNGGVFENGNYAVLPLSPIDTLICSYKAEKIDNKRIAHQLNKDLQKLSINLGYVIDEEFVKSRIVNIYEMYDSFCKSYVSSVSYRQSHPYRRG